MCGIELYKNIYPKNSIESGNLLNLAVTSGMSSIMCKKIQKNTTKSGGISP